MTPYCSIVNGMKQPKWLSSMMNPGGYTRESIPRQRGAAEEAVQEMSEEMVQHLIDNGMALPVEKLHDMLMEQMQLMEKLMIERKLKEAREQAGPDGALSEGNSQETRARGSSDGGPAPGGGGPPGVHLDGEAVAAMDPEATIGFVVRVPGRDGAEHEVRVACALGDATPMEGGAGGDEDEDEAEDEVDGGDEGEE